jgi:uncharacterized cupin superfamily protein
MEASMGPKVNKSTAQHFLWGDNCDGWHLAQHPSAAVIEEIMLPHTSEKRHFHEKIWQFIYILSGELEIEIEGQEYILKPFDGISIEPSQKHNFFNRTDKDIHYLLVSAPNINDRINL